MAHSVLVRDLGIVDYLVTLKEMQRFTTMRSELTMDELWCTQHYPVYTQGQAGLAKHIKYAGNIPVIQSDRGGQITYHGPGQLIVYVLSNLQRLKLDLKAFTWRLEEAIIKMLRRFNIEAKRKPHAPGVYVDGAKIAFLGIRIKRWCSYHGLSLNVAMDLEPFHGIDPCGFTELPITQLQALGITESVLSIQKFLIAELLNVFEYHCLEAQYA